MRKCINILGVNIDDITMEIAKRKIIEFLHEGKNHIICTPNAEIMMESYKDKALKNVLNSSDMVVADGAGVVLASKILGTPLKERIAGYDLVQGIFGLKLDRKIRVFLLGSHLDVAKRAVENYSELEGIEFVGYCSGYFKEEDEEGIIDRINELSPDILLVGLGAPKQEKWIYENRDRLKVKVSIGVGGTFDVMAKRVKRAPKFFQDNGLEWFYRLCKQPSRFFRMLNIPRFMLLILKEKAFGE